ncbi:MAG: phosphatidate cytidylyltransferase [Bdellovibrio sp.]|nr:MAG: phosphatidate cytidylyltransferase [Bdellovibrio sp.]
MTTTGLWGEPLFKEIGLLILAFLFLVGAISFFLYKRNPKLIGLWASIKSWMIAATLIFFAAGLPSPWPLFVLLLIAIYGSKTFYKMVGMYHRSWFVWMNYLFILLLGHWIFHKQDLLFQTSPMLYLASICTIPLIRNSAKRMIQYLALSLMSFVFFGWSFLHLGQILMLPKGIYILIYLYILTAFSENINFLGNKWLGKHKLFSNISQRISIESIIFSFIFTLTLAWGLRHLLPYRQEPFWIMSGTIATFLGRFGELIISVIRKDLGIKSSGIFIIGRDDIIARVDKLIFVAPFFYYFYLYLSKVYGV